MTTPRKAGVIGWPIAQSRSPLIHQTWLEEFSIEGSYEKYPVRPEALVNFIQCLQKNSFEGLNLTIPHKEAVLDLADQTTEDARAIGAANTLWFEAGKLIAGNTDAYGFITHLKTAAPTWQSSGPAMVLGAGGAARAIIHALNQEHLPEIFLTNRTKDRAEKLKTEFGSKIRVIPWDERHKWLSHCALLVNTTSLGMINKPALEMDISALPGDAVVYDIVYVPIETELLKAAKTKGHQTVDGLGMLLHQAVPGFERWFGVRPKVSDALYQKVLADILAKEPTG